jgi:hypothetical protein
MADGKNVEAAKKRLYEVRLGGRNCKAVKVDMLESQREDLLKFDRSLQRDGKKPARRLS